MVITPATDVVAATTKAPAAKVMARKDWAAQCTRTIQTAVTSVAFAAAPTIADHGRRAMYAAH